MMSISPLRHPLLYQSDLPKHLGPNILPSFPLFSKLLTFATRRTSIAIRDVIGDSKYEATHLQLLSDTLRVRDVLLEQLSREVRLQLLSGHPVFINLLAPGGYQFAVAFLAIVAAGAIVVPLSSTVALEEAIYFVEKTSAQGVVVASSCAAIGDQLAHRVRQSQKSAYLCLEIEPNIHNAPLRSDEIYISCDHELNYHQPGIIIFTSGSTGRPKAAVKPRSYMDTSPRLLAAHYDSNETDTLIHCLPIHHATGLGVNFLTFLSIGALIEFHPQGFNPARMWDRWRQGGITVFSGVPTIYSRMMRHFQTVSAEEQEKNTVCARRLRLLLCGSSALPHPLQESWMKMLGGDRKILVRYGSTEMGMVFGTRNEDYDVPDGSVGKKVMGVDVKLSNVTEGEILVKSPEIFKMYLGDSQATVQAFDSDGYYKTGDIARRNGPWYFISGRASVDIIKSGGYKISALDIERECLGLDYVEEVTVVGIEDSEYGERVAAAVVLKPEKRATLHIDDLRTSLRHRITSYKLPTLLRVVEHLPRTVSGKIVKKDVKMSLFPIGHPEVQRWSPKRRTAKL